MNILGIPIIPLISIILIVVIVGVLASIITNFVIIAKKPEPQPKTSHVQRLREIKDTSISKFKALNHKDKLYRHLRHIQNLKVMVLCHLDIEEQSHLAQIEEEARILWEGTKKFNRN